jgi:ABC-type lipoprotein export system ATPase subunit
MVTHERDLAHIAQRIVTLSDGKVLGQTTRQSRRDARRKSAAK